MGRLIDASVFAESLILCDGLGRKSLESVLSALKNQPTAYDVEKVVAELEERRTKHDCVYCKHYSDGKKECEEDCTDALIDDLFEIVRKGGVE